MRARQLDVLERHPGATFAILGMLALAAYLVALIFFPRPHGRILDGDAIQYYAYLRSVLFDGDLDFRNDYAVLYRPARAGSEDNVWLTARTPTGRAPNMMAIGPALLWAPFVLLTVLVAALLNWLGANVPLDGFAAPYQLAAGAAGIVYATAGVCLCYRLGARVFDGHPAFWGALVAWLGTSAVYYWLVSPAYGHAVSLFTVALFTWTWCVTRADGWPPRRAALLGALGGLAALVRWQDAVVFALPVVELALQLARGQIAYRRLAATLLIMGLVASLLMSGQFVAWQRIYGSWLVIPQGPEFMRWTEPALREVLLSTRHGLFVWTPAVLPAVIGLAFVLRRDPVLGWGALAVLGLSLYINASVSDWWAGEAFGARRFVGDTIFFALGFTALFAVPWRRDRSSLTRVAALALIAYNLLFLLQYQLFMRGFHDLAPYPTTIRQILFDRLTLPWRLLAAWLARSS